MVCSSEWVARVPEIPKQSATRSQVAPLTLPRLLCWPGAHTELLLPLLPPSPSAAVSPVGTPVPGANGAPVKRWRRPVLRHHGTELRQVRNSVSFAVAPQFGVRTALLAALVVDSASADPTMTGRSGVRETVAIAVRQGSHFDLDLRLRLVREVF